MKALSMIPQAWKASDGHCMTFLNAWGETRQVLDGKMYLTIFRCSDWSITHHVYGFSDWQEAFAYFMVEVSKYPMVLGAGK